MPEVTLEQALNAAQAEVEKHLLCDHAHAIYQGLKNGTGEPCIVVEVLEKLSAQQLKEKSLEAVPAFIDVGGHRILTDVVQEPMATTDKLRTMSIHGPQAVRDHQACHNAPIPGGMQISPDGANWVGTLGAGVIFEGDEGGIRFGAITNNHVAVTQFPRRGDRIFQPWHSGEFFGKLYRWKRLDFRAGVHNLVDLAVIDCRRTEGKYAPITHTVNNKLFDIRGVVAHDTYNNPNVGLNVTKSGRTTGVTTGSLVGKNATLRVQYDEGVATFNKQLVFRGANGGEFSAAGDSGSLIVSQDGLKPVALLFAGGGGTTIGNPIGEVMRIGKCRFFPTNTQSRV